MLRCPAPAHPDIPTEASAALPTNAATIHLPADRWLLQPEAQVPATAMVTLRPVGRPLQARALTSAPLLQATAARAARPTDLIPALAVRSAADAAPATAVAAVPATAPAAAVPALQASVEEAVLAHPASVADAPVAAVVPA